MTVASAPILAAPILAAAFIAGALPALAAGPAAPPPPATAVGPGAAGTYTFDPDHSQIVFAYDHMGYSTSRGVINGIEGKVTLDPADPAKSTVEARFPLGAIRMIAEHLDEALFGPDLLNGASRATEVTFKSTAVKVRDDHDAEVTGDLTLNGITRPVTLDVDLVKAADSPMSGAPTAGFAIRGAIMRSDFKLDAFAPAVGDEVRFDIGVEASKG